MDSQEDKQPLGILLRNARRAKRLSGVQLAAMANCTQSAISQFEGGKTTALKRETVLKIGEILGVEIPDEPETPPVIIQDTALRTSTPKDAFCPNGECPSNVPYTVGGELLLYPRKQPNPTAVYCPWCGEVLEHDCPQCQEPATQTAFCPQCGTKRVEPPTDISNPEEWAQMRRTQIAELDNLI